MWFPERCPHFKRCWYFAALIPAHVHLLLARPPLVSAALTISATRSIGARAPPLGLETASLPRSRASSRRAPTSARRGAASRPKRWPSVAARWSSAWNAGSAQRSTDGAEIARRIARRVDALAYVEPPAGRFLFFNSVFVFKVLYPSSFGKSVCGFPNAVHISKGVGSYLPR